jgi:hypothetical protein
MWWQGLAIPMTALPRWQPVQGTSINPQAPPRACDPRRSSGALYHTLCTSLSYDKQSLNIDCCYCLSFFILVAAFVGFDMIVVRRDGNSTSG